MATEKQPQVIQNSEIPLNVEQELAKLSFLDRLDAEEKLQRKQARIDAEESAKKMRLSVIEQVRAAEHTKRLAQRTCDHEKPNKMPNLNGQKDHNGTYHLICSRCQMHFTQHTCPPSLWQKLNFDHIGGPQT